jgi:mannose-6-phosphate isomerase-like protein (cupin superfamily)
MADFESNKVVSEKKDPSEDFYNKRINFAEKFSTFSEHWSPRVVAEMNNYQIKVAKVCGDFVWHKHDDTDEVFIIIEGTLFIDFETGPVELKQGEMCVVKKAGTQ